MTKKINYLNNKDLLLAIHRSKNTYCTYSQPEYHQYDIIVQEVDQINQSQYIELAQRARAKRLAQEQYDAAKPLNPKAKLADFEIDPTSIPLSDLIFRVNTFEHIPLAPGRKKSVKTEADGKERVNFPPFQHWKFNDAGIAICVGKSHWIGDLEAGKFSKDHGQITETLARMFIKLSEKYATRGNVRGYTYNDEMKGQAILQLTQIGLQFDESKSDNPFAYFTAAVKNSFVRVINIEKRMQNIRDDMLEMNGMNPSFTRTMNHEFDIHAKRDADLGDI